MSSLIAWLASLWTTSSTIDFPQTPTNLLINSAGATYADSTQILWVRRPKEFDDVTSNITPAPQPTLAPAAPKPSWRTASSLAGLLRNTVYSPWALVAAALLVVGSAVFPWVPAASSRYTGFDQNLLYVDQSGRGHVQLNRQRASLLTGPGS